MAFLGQFVFLLTVVHSLTVPVNCNDNAYKQDTEGANKTAALDACIGTRWCVWNEVNSPGTNCVVDGCLEWYANDDNDANTKCLTRGSWCKLYYITDSVTCSNTVDGTPKTQTDLFCRTGSDTTTKKPVDACFYQDLAGRSQATPASTCVNVAGLSCVWDNNSTKNYCYDSGAPQPITSYGVDDDAYCQSLGKTYCNLYPSCTLSSDGNKCVVDPCSRLTPTGSIGAGTCTGAGGSHCSVVTAQKVSDTGTLSLDSAKTQCVSKESWSGVKKNEYNSCFYAYTGFKAPNASAFNYPSCYQTNERSKCGGAAGDAIVYNNQGTTPTDDTYCQLVDIAEGYLPTEKYCWDGIVSYPKPDAGFAVHIPSLLLLAGALIAALF